ncbi:hypothetical protein B0H19DRAFT_1082844 [Mycena capillaripes]|nr:hypothetical protein B0H19DRAFT_1082844 [Mycena capillaripes]
MSLRNQEMLQYLRMCPEFGALPVEDRFVLGLLVPQEDIAVEIMEGPELPFSGKFDIPMFQKRMLLNKDIWLEFITRGVPFHFSDWLWRLTFLTPDHPSVSASGSPPWFMKHKNDHICIAPDGSITGILGVKLKTGKVLASWPPATILPKPEEECVIF